MTVTIEQVRSHIEGLVAEKCSNATPGQRQALVDRLMDQDAVRDEALRPLIMHPEIGAALNLDTILRNEPDLIKTAPSAADVLAYRVADYTSKIGVPPPAEMRMNWHRELQNADADALLSSGAEPGTAVKVEASERKAAASPDAVHLWSLDDPRWQFEVGKRTGRHPASMLPSEVRNVIDHLQNESRKAATNNMHPKDIDARAAILSKPEDKRSAEERMTLTRLGG